jgi:thiol-disulfide isomerase/thioredoxin
MSGGKPGEGMVAYMRRLRAEAENDLAEVKGISAQMKEASSERKSALEEVLQISQEIRECSTKVSDAKTMVEIGQASANEQLNQTLSHVFKLFQSDEPDFFQHIVNSQAAISLTERLSPCTTLVKNDGSAVHVGDLANTDVVGIYFSAHWCHPCRGFTPELVKVHEELTSAGKSFQVVFVSSDLNEDAFKEYFAQMPWLALPFRERDLKDKLEEEFGVNGIPSLVLLTGAGKDIVRDGRATITNFGAAAFPFDVERAQEGTGSVCILTTLRGMVPCVVHSWLEYHHSIGISHFILFFEDEHDPCIAVARSFNEQQCKAIRTATLPGAETRAEDKAAQVATGKLHAVTILIVNNALRQKQQQLCSCYARLQDHLGESGHGGLISRQQINMEYAVHLCLQSNSEQANCDQGAGSGSIESISWLVHIDLDELLFFPPASNISGADSDADARGTRTAREHFADCARQGLQQVVYLNLEAVPEQPAELVDASGKVSRNYFEHVSLFKMNQQAMRGGLLARWQRQKHEREGGGQEKGEGGGGDESGRRGWKEGGRWREGKGWRT